MTRVARAAAVATCAYRKPHRAIDGESWAHPELAQVVNAFQLKRATPHNFLVLRPDPPVWTPACGIVPPDDAAALS